MARVLLPLLVLLLALSPGGALSLTMAQDCPAAGKVVGETDTQVIKNTTENSLGYSELIVYVKTRPDFKGVGLKVQGSSARVYDAWFPADPECFGNIDKWHLLWLVAWIDRDTNTLRFRLRIGTCWRACITNSHPQRPWRFSVVAHGHSQWLLDWPPPSCDTVNLTWIGFPSTLPTCKDPPPPVSVEIPVVVVVFLVVLAAAVMVVMLIRRRRQRQQLPTPNEVRFQSRPADQTQQVQFQSRPAHPTQQGQFSPRPVQVLHEIEGEIYLQMVTQLPRLSESHFYDSVNFNNIAALDRGRSPQVTESGGYANEALYDDVADPDEHRGAPQSPEEPIYLAVL